MDKKISIIMPAYNCGNLIDRSIESLLNQTYTNFEVVIVDDGSTDNTGEYCDSWAKKDSRIKVIHKQNGGPSSARNVGISRATGDYVYFIDSDDALKPNGLEVLLETMQKDDVDLVICGYEVSCGKESRQVCLPTRHGINSGDTQQFLEMFNKVLFNSLCNKLFKKEKIKNFLNEEIKWGEDLQFNLEYFKGVQTYTIIEDCLYIYYIYGNSGSLTSMSLKKKYDQNIKSIPERIKHVKALFGNNKLILSATCGDFVNVSKEVIRDLVLNADNYKQVKKDMKSIINHSLLRKTLGYYVPDCRNDKIMKLLLKLKMAKLIYKLYKIKLNKEKRNTNVRDVN